MALVKLKLEDKTVLEKGWANPNQRKVGDVTEYGFTVYDIDQAEIDQFVVDYTKLIDGHLVVDADYVPPVIDTTPMPTEQDSINAQLLQQAAEQQMTNAEIVKEIATIKGGN